jgi:hypothetical protein
MKPSITTVALLLIAVLARAAEPATVTVQGKSWTLRNASFQATASFSSGSLSLTSFYNREAKVEYLKGRPRAPLFSHRVNGWTNTASDGGWTLASATVSDIELYGIKWGQRLEITLTRQQPVAFCVRQVFEVYNGQAGLRCLSLLKNGTDQKLTLGASEVLSLQLPDQPHTLYFIEGVLNWQATQGGLTNGGRNALVRYASGDGWFLVPENNWATCLEAGASKAHSREKLLGIHAWNGQPGVRVATNPKAVQLVLFPQEEVEYFAVNLGVFKGEVLDARMAVAEHFRQRYKFHDPSRVLSINDWQWGGQGGRRTDANYRNIVIPKAMAAGFDRINIDDFWYEPEDGVDPKDKWTEMPSLCDLIVANGMQPGHWFSLQGKICVHGWGNGRDCADPANVDFKLKQMRETLIGKYHSAWDQVDAGLLWKTDEETPYSHPGDSVYRKILGLRRYMNTIAHEQPDFIMQTTCEVDNPAGPGSGDSHGNQNVGLLHLADNGIAGMFRRTEYGDDVRDLFADVGMFPLEGMLSTWGEDGNAAAAWRDSPLWYYQFLLARHTSIYSWPGDWFDAAVAHLRVFNDWRKNPRIKAVLNELLRPVYCGGDWLKNEGPWAWLFTGERKSKALLFAINHLDLAANNEFAAKLSGLDPTKTYLIEEITQTPGGKFAYAYRGEYPGRQLVNWGLPIDLDDRPEPCAAFWIQEKTSSKPRVLYADAAILRYTEKASGSRLAVDLEGVANASACLWVVKPAANGVERREVKLDTAGRARAEFDAGTVTDPAQPLTLASPAQPATAVFAARDATTAGQWRGKYGSTAAWLAGHPPAGPAGYALRLRNGTLHVWGQDDRTARVPDPPPGAAGSKLAACWTAASEFDLRLRSPQRAHPYKLTVYLMDYDNVRYPARAMEVSLRTHDGKVLDTQRATKEETAAGIYLTWTVSGPVTVHARKTEGFNAAVSGVFVDEIR